MKTNSFFAITLGLYQLASLPSKAGAQAASNPGVPEAAPNSPVAVVLKNPLILQNGEQVELQGRWLYKKDGTPVFVQEVPTPTPQVPTHNAPSGASTFVFLAPPPGVACAPQYQYFVPTYHSRQFYYHHYPAHPYYRSGYGGGYGYRTSYYSRPGRARYGYRSDGALVLLPSRYSW